MTDPELLELEEQNGELQARIEELKEDRSIFEDELDDIYDALELGPGAEHRDALNKIDELKEAASE